MQNKLYTVIICLIAIFTSYADELQPIDHITGAQTLIAKGEYEQARQILDNMDESSLSPAEAGLKNFFTGETAWQMGVYEEAYIYFNRALDTLESDFYRSETLWRLANYYAQKNNRSEAADYAVRSAELLPGNEMRALQAAYLLISIGEDEQAALYIRSVVDNGSDTADEASLTLEMYYIYKRLNDRNNQLIWLRRYIDIQSAKGDTLTIEEQRLLYGARREHADNTRILGWYSGLYANIWGNNDYAIQAINEVYWQPWYSNGRHVQLFGQMINTISARYSTEVYDFVSGTVIQSYSRSYVYDSSYFLLGGRLDPFKSLNVSITAEHIMKIGTDHDLNYDTRFRLAHSWDTGVELRPTDSHWNFVTLYHEGIYSVDNDQVTYGGEGRLGHSFSLNDISSNLVATLFAGTTWGYDGELIAKGQRWRMDAGPGLYIRKWHREDKYNAPRSYLDVIFQYRWGISKDREDVFAITLFHSF